MNIYFQSLDPQTRNKVIVRTMGNILKKGKKRKPKSDKDWVKLWEEACDKINRNNFAINIKH